MEKGSGLGDKDEEEFIPFEGYEKKYVRID